VPDAAGVLTSCAGWNVAENFDFLTEVVERFRDAGIRTSIFVDPDVETIKLAAQTGADRVELYTKPYADNYENDRDVAIAPYIEASKAAHNLGLGVNAGHDLSLANLKFFHDKMPYLNEVSIGHALICDALYLGLEETIKQYRACLVDKK
jgi:pyridoxine 5-phosphate synthase